MTTKQFEKTYSLAEIASKIGKPPTTISTWKTQFQEFLPTIGEGRSRRYKEEAVELFSLIARMKESGEPAERIRSVLQETATEITVYEEDTSHPPLLQEMMESYAGILREMQEQREIIEEQRRVIDELQETVSNSFKEIEGKSEEREKRLEDRDKALMETLKALQEEKKKKKGWLGIFRG